MRPLHKGLALRAERHAAHTPVTLHRLRLHQPAVFQTFQGARDHRLADADGLAQLAHAQDAATGSPAPPAPFVTFGAPW